MWRRPRPERPPIPARAYGGPGLPRRLKLQQAPISRPATISSAPATIRIQPITGITVTQRMTPITSARMPRPTIPYFLLSSPRPTPALRVWIRVRGVERTQEASAYLDEGVGGARLTYPRWRDWRSAPRAAATRGGGDDDGQRGESRSGARRAGLEEAGRETRRRAETGSGWYAWLARGGLVAKGVSYGIVG